MTKQPELLTFVRLLRELFKTLVYGVPDGLKGEISGEIIELVKVKPGAGVSEFPDRTLQLDESYLRPELKAEKTGAFQD